MQEQFYPEGMLIDSGENLKSLFSLAALEKTAQTGKIVEARALLCDGDMNLVFDLNGIKGIMPKSEVALCEEGKEFRDIAVITRVGKAVCFVITDIKRTDKGAVCILSRRLAQKRCLDNYLDHLNDGDVIRARVTHFEPFGCFCDIGCGIVSLMSIDCICVSRIAHPSDRFYQGQLIYAAVKGRDEILLGNRGRIALTHKELLGTWQENADKFSVGQTVAGVIRSVEDYGIFVELTPNLAGLAERRDNVIPGQGAAVYIKNIIPQKMKIKLVLVDTDFSAKSRIRCDYFITEGNVSDWVYPPDCYRRR